MKTAINAYITFNGQAREAMTFYKNCLGGELTLQPVGDMPLEGQCEGAAPETIMHSSLIKDGMVLMASDMMGGQDFIVGNNISLTINCSTEEEINTFFSNLSAGGRVIMPLKVEFWGALFGVLTDKFGINWMFNYDKNQGKE